MRNYKKICSILYLIISTYNLSWDEKNIPSYPYITGLGFKSIAHYVLDKENTFDPEAINKKSIIFVIISKLKDFFENYHPKIRFPYILITHNHFSGAPAELSNFLEDEKIIHWFTKNPTIINHPKLTGIPIGIPNNYLERGNPIIFSSVRNLKISKRFTIYMNFSIDTSPEERTKVYELFADNKFVLSKQPTLSIDEYLIDLKLSKFSLSPRGMGLDCHRTWEAILMGCIPIVLTSALDPIFQDLPVLIVKKWEDCNEDCLYKFLNQKKQFKLQKIYIDYWLNLIMDKFNASSIIN